VKDALSERFAKQVLVLDTFRINFVLIYVFDASKDDEHLVSRVARTVLNNRWHKNVACFVFDD